ncbi:MAG: hypothetical protein KA007_02085 [Candidatus Pacebacteria bacterium]|nr:hypothetical protein [Candidatus Paceibacterota bacterium]
MKIASSLGLSDEVFCRMIVTTKMLLSNVIGHAAELHYEKDLIKNKISYIKAPTDVYYDYTVGKFRDQVKRFESASTNKEFLAANLTKTHGDRIGEGGFYKRGSFDRLVLLDVGFSKTFIIDEEEIPKNKKFDDRLPGKFKIKRDLDEKLEFEIKFLNAMKIANKGFPKAIDALRKEAGFSYAQLLTKICDLSLSEIDSLFSSENFRLVVGAKGFAAEEHFNVLLDENNIEYEQIKDMYSKWDHLVNKKIRVQVKTIHGRSTDSDYYGFKTHKSHGSGVSELYKNNEFDVLALFVGFDIDTDEDLYIPKNSKNEFILIPASDLEDHPKYPGYLKRVTKVRRDKYKINDLSLLK